MVAAPSLPTFCQIRDDMLRVFNVQLCISQIEAAVVQLEQESDVVYISGTGPGKTLTFRMPILYEEGSITILVTALNILRKQTVNLLDAMGIPAINLTGANAGREIFRITFYLTLLINSLLGDKRLQISFNCGGT